MNRSTKGVVAVAAAGVLGGAGSLAVWVSSVSAPGVVDVIQRQWALGLIVIGLVGYAAALVVATFGRRRPRHVSS